MPAQLAERRPDEREIEKTGQVSRRAGFVNPNNQRNVLNRGLPVFPYTVPPPVFTFVAVTAAAAAQLPKRLTVTLQAVNRSSVY
jgi:hypothetical protein